MFLSDNANSPQVCSIQSLLINNLKNNTLKATPAIVSILAPDCEIMKKNSSTTGQYGIID